MTELRSEKVSRVPGNGPCTCQYECSCGGPTRFARTSLRVPQYLLAELRSQARHTRGEVCGVITVHAFTEVDARVPVWSARSVRNVAEEPEHFYQFDTREYVDLMEKLKEAGSRVHGIYHSHPQGPSRLSAVDLDACAPGSFHWLVHGRTGEVTLWFVNSALQPTKLLYEVEP